MTLVVEMGRVAFPSAHARMLELADRVAAGASAGEVWLLEHDPVFTSGRATHAADQAAVGAIPVERGGQITYHGPGQLVVYPIIRLPERDAGAWLRRLHSFGRAVCTHLGIETAPAADRTGVFAAGRKVGSIGVALRRWVNLHGISLNVAMDLAPFFRTHPCGLPPEIMSDLSRIAGQPVSMAAAVAAARRALCELGVDDLAQAPNATAR